MILRCLYLLVSWISLVSAQSVPLTLITTPSLITLTTYTTNVTWPPGFNPVTQEWNPGMGYPVKLNLSSEPTRSDAVQILSINIDHAAPWLTIPIGYHLGAVPYAGKYFQPVVDSSLLTPGTYLGVITIGYQVDVDPVLKYTTVNVSVTCLPHIDITTTAYPASGAVSPYSSHILTTSNPTATVTMKLQSRPLKNVIVAIQPNRYVKYYGLTGGTLQATPMSLTFSSRDNDTNAWDQSQSFTITTVQPPRYLGNRDITIGYVISSQDPAYATYTLPDWNITVVDSYKVDIIWNTTSIVLTEGSLDNTSLTLSLTSQPTGDIRITLTNTSRITLTPGVIWLGPGNWSTKILVKIGLVQDSIITGLSTPIITFPTRVYSNSDASYNGLQLSSLTFIIWDDDMSVFTISPSFAFTDPTTGATNTNITITFLIPLTFSATQYGSNTLPDIKCYWNTHGVNPIQNTITVGAVKGIQKAMCPVPACEISITKCVSPTYLIISISNQSMSEIPFTYVDAPLIAALTPLQVDVTNPTRVAVTLTSSITDEKFLNEMKSLMWCRVGGVNSVMTYENGQYICVAPARNDLAGNTDAVTQPFSISLNGQDVITAKFQIQYVDMQRSADNQKTTYFIILMVLMGLICVGILLKDTVCKNLCKKKKQEDTTAAVTRQTVGPQMLIDELEPKIFAQLQAMNATTVAAALNRASEHDIVDAKELKRLAREERHRQRKADKDMQRQMEKAHEMQRKATSGREEGDGTATISSLAVATATPAAVEMVSTTIHLDDSDKKEHEKSKEMEITTGAETADTQVDTAHDTPLDTARTDLDTARTDRSTIDEDTEIESGGNTARESETGPNTARAEVESKEPETAAAAVSSPAATKKGKSSSKKDKKSSKKGKEKDKKGSKKGKDGSKKKKKSSKKYI